MSVNLATMIAVALVALGIALIIRVSDTVPRRAQAEADYAAFRGDPVSLALLSGGPVRAFDATLVQLIERRVVRVEGGRFSVGSAVPAGGLTEPEATMLRLVAESENNNLDQLRMRWWASSMPTTVRAWRDQGLLIGPPRRLWSWAIVSAPAFVLQSIVLLASLDGLRSEGEQTQFVYLAIVWFGTVIIVPVVLASRPGFRGRSVVSARGRAVVRRARQADDGSQALLVATGGFAAMTDARLRSQVQGSAPDSGWNSRPGAYESDDVNASATMRVGMGTPQLDITTY